MSRLLYKKMGLGGPGDPPWAKDRTRVNMFQDYINKEYPGTIRMPGGVGAGNYGSQSRDAYTKYGTEYENFYNKSVSPERPPLTTRTYLNSDVQPQNGPVTSYVPRVQRQNSMAPTATPLQAGNPVDINAPDENGLTPAQSSVVRKGIFKTIGIKRDIGALATDGVNAGIEKGIPPLPKVSNVGRLLKGATPFASNIVNAFRKPPMPKQGVSDQYTALQKVNFDNDRYQVSSATQAANKATERNVDANTAEAVKAFNRGDEFSKLSSITDVETRTNTAIANQQATMDAQVSAANTSKKNKYLDETVERQVAQQREQSANWANAGDKAVMIQNEKEKGRVELAKARVLSSLYNKSGVLTRDVGGRGMMRDMGLPDPLGLDYKDVEAKGTTARLKREAEEKKNNSTSMAMGGMMRLPSKKVY